MQARIFAFRLHCSIGAACHCHAAIWMLLWALLIPGRQCAAAQTTQGSWQLQISGHHSFVFGETGFGGGIRIPWEVVIQFQVRDGDYLLGSGSARWLDRVEGISQPPGWFRCQQVAGTYLDSNLALHQTPRVRFAAFPVGGSMMQGRVRLQPGYQPPGNYLAVTYECVDEGVRAENWFALAERGKQVLGKRQDVETRRDPERQIARVREVAALPPERSIELPLEDGWTFSQGGADDGSAVRFRLQRLDD